MFEPFQRDGKLSVAEFERMLPAVRDAADPDRNGREFYRQFHVAQRNHRQHGLMVDHSEQELFLLFAFEQGQFRAGREILRTDQEGRQQLCEQLFSERLLGVLTERQQSGVEPDRFSAAVRVFNPAGEFRCSPGRVGVNRCVLFRGRRAENRGAKQPP